MPDTSVSDNLKAAMRLAPATVAVVTAALNGESNGLTATSFCSVSMDPPSMLVCVNQDSNTHEMIKQSGHYCVNLLHHNQKDLAGSFASPGTGQEKFERVNANVVQLDGIPALQDAMARIVCKISDALDVGTHTIFVGTATHVEVVEDAVPLLYGLHSFGSFKAD